MNLDLNPQNRHENIAAAVLAAIVGLGSIGALLQATGHPVTALLVLAALGIVVAGVRWVARVLRERREDRADALAAIAWRARHLPDHPLTARDRAAGRTGLVRAGVR